MTPINDRINRRIALAQLTAATVLAAGAARAQRPDPSLAQIKTTDLGRKTYMLEGLGGNILVVVGDDGIIMVDAELAPLHDKIKAAITNNSNLPIKYLIDTHFHGEQTGGNAPFHRDGAIVVAQDNVRVRLLAGTTNGVNYNKSPPAQPDAIPTETYVGGTKTVEVRGRRALLTHATNAHTDGDSWIHLADANVIFTGDLFYNNSRYPMIDYANGGDIRGMVRANEAFLDAGECRDQDRLEPRRRRGRQGAGGGIPRHAGDGARPHGGHGRQGHDRGGGGGGQALCGPRCQVGRRRAGLGQFHPQRLQLVQTVLTAARLSVRTGVFPGCACA